MNIYIISQDVNGGYDRYSAAVVVASSEEEARTLHPSGNPDDNSSNTHNWAPPANVKVEFLGETELYTVAGVILGSYHAG